MSLYILISVFLLIIIFSKQASRVTHLNSEYYPDKFFISLERILSYLKIDHEPRATEGVTPPAYWPASGELRVEGLSARYSEGM